MKIKAFVLLGHIAWFLCGAGASVPVALWALWSQSDPSWLHWVLPVFCSICLLLFPFAWYAQRWTRQQIDEILNNAEQRGDEDKVVFTKEDIERLGQFAPEMAGAIKAMSEKRTEV